MRLFFVLLSLLPFAANAGRVAQTAAEFRAAVAGALPGDTVLLKRGAHDFGGAIVVDRSGVPGRPIVLAAERRGRVELTGDSRFFLEGASHVVITGFRFTSTDGPAVRLRGCTHVRVTGNIFRLREKGKSNWLLITGIPGDTIQLSRGNRVDHNLFEKKRELGNFLTIEGTRKARTQVSQYDTIDHNHFRDIGPRAENVLEAIRVGSSEFSLSSGYTLLERNLFERCDGDPEYLSIKSSDNVVRGNTFRECLGVLSLRHGNRNRIEGNFILGKGRSGTFRDSTGRIWRLGTGGVRFCGDSMAIVNNYFEGLTGTRWDATLAVPNGDARYGDGQPLTKHFVIRDALISSNIFVNNASAIEIGYNGEGFQGNWWRMPPERLRISNNIIVGKGDTLVRLFSRPVESWWEGNVLYPGHERSAPGSLPDGIAVRDPGLRNVGGIWRPGRGSNAMPQARPLRASDVGPFASDR